MATGLNRLLSRNRATAQLSDAEYGLVLSELDPRARSILTRLARGQGITPEENERLVAALRRQGATGRQPEGSQTEAGKMWRRVLAREGLLRADATPPDDLDDAATTRAGGNAPGVMWRNAYARIGRLKEPPDDGEPQ